MKYAALSALMPLLMSWNAFGSPDPRTIFSLKIDDVDQVVALLDMPDDCRPQAASLVKDIKRYFEAGAHKSRKIDGITKALRIAVATGKKGPCTRFLGATYIAASFYEGLSKTIRLKKRFHETFGRPEQIQVALVTGIINRGRLLLLDSDLRGELSRKFGLVWTLKENGAYKLVGAYDCHTGTSYVAEELLPFDILATVNHEMAHLFDDKNLSSALNTLPVRNRIAIGEYVASIHGSFLQLKANDGGGARRRFDFLNIMPWRQVWNFQLPGDLSFFNPEGNVYKMWRRIGFFLDAGTLASFVERTLVDEVHYKLNGLTNPENKNHDDIEPFLTASFDYVTRAYFPDFHQDLYSAFHGLPHRPYLEWFDVAQLIPYQVWIGKTEVLDDPRALTAIHDFIADLGQPSPLCEAFDKAYAAGEFKGYVGGAPSGENGVRPAFPVRPCLFLRP